MRPALKAGLLPVWRDRETVQIGIDPRRAVALTGMGDAALVIGLLDGSRERGQVIAAAREQGIQEAVTDRIITLLAAGGALDDFPAAAMSALSQEQRQRLSAELAAAALASGHSDAGATALARRGAARVQVYGPGRIAVGIADILATSGVGHVAICDTVRPAQSPAGARPGRGARVRARDVSGVCGGGGGRQLGELPDLAVLVGYRDPELPAALVRAGVAHLAVMAEEAIGVVGPLVRPGRTACLRCLDLIRSGLDPAWPLILAQLAGRTASPPACDAALAATVTGQAAGQVLAFLDRQPASAPTENGTLELVPPGWQWRRRTWPPHPSCGCQAASAG